MTETKKDDIADVIERLNKMEKTSDSKDAEIVSLKAELKKLSESNSNKASGHDDELVDDIRRSVDNVEIVVYGEEEAPVVGVKIIRNFDKDGKELNSQVELNVIGYDKPVKVSYGNLENPGDFMQLKTKKFTLVDILDGDLTGASKIRRDVISEDNGTVAEMKLTGEAYVPTGRQVRQVVRKDIRYYTIEFGGKKYELGEPIKEVDGYKLIRK